MKFRMQVGIIKTRSFANNEKKKKKRSNAMVLKHVIITKRLFQDHFKALQCFQ